MTSQELKAVCEELGFKICLARRMPRSTEVRAYLFMYNDQYPEVDELRWRPADPDRLACFHHATKPNGWTQYDQLTHFVDLETKRIYQVVKLMNY
jgi:hypothetical protein